MFLLMLLLSVLLAGCGGGGGDGGSGGGGGGTLYSVGGTISGLNGTVVLRNNGGNDLSRSANGSSYAVTAANGTTTRTYTVAVTRQSGSGFAQQAYIKASNPDGVAENSARAGDQFGYATALSDDGNTLVVGAVYESSNATGINGNQANNSASGSGAVYVFARSGTTWSQRAYVKSSNSEAGDLFGHSIALSGNGDTLAVGADGEDSSAPGINGDQTNNTRTSSGAVYVFTGVGAD